MFEGKRVIFIGAHTDDLELGCGGLISQLRHLEPTILIFSSAVDSNPGYDLRKECRESFKEYGLDPVLLDFKTRYFDSDPQAIRDKLHLYRHYDVFITHSSNSMHQDHKIIGKSVEDMMFDKTVLAFEDIHSGQNMQGPYWWNEISEEDMKLKFKALSHYHSQQKRRYFDNEYFKALLTYRGNQIHVPYAEIFELKRITTFLK